MDSNRLFHRDHCRYKQVCGDEMVNFSMLIYADAQMSLDDSRLKAAE
jgi:hypothetical protein